MRRSQRPRPERRRLRAVATLACLWVAGLAVLPAGMPAARAQAGGAEPAARAPVRLRLGTGFFVTAQGHLLTADHVLRDGGRVFVKPDGAAAPLPAQVLRRDAQRDLALLKVAPPAPVPALALADWRTVPMGLEAYVLGYPLPGVQGTSIKITQGIINGLAGGGRNAMLFQLSAEVQRGNSGGPVLSPDGLVTGMVFSKLDALRVLERERDLPQNVNYALNAAALAEFLQGEAVAVAPPDLAVQRRPHEILAAARASVALVLALPQGTPPRPDAP